MQLAPYPPSPADPGGRLVTCLGAGRLASPPESVAPGRGRVRRWMYAAAGDGTAAVGAAIVDIGVAGTVFAWALLEDELVRWETRRLLAAGCVVGRSSGTGASFSGGGATVVIGGEGSLRIDVPTGDHGRLRAQVRTGAVTPAVLTTPTPEGGWNATEKAAGYTAVGRIAAGGRSRRLDGGGWRDWTTGRQDRRTTWRWAAGAGRSRVGAARVGLNVSTGMNAAAAGEDVVWWDGVPYALAVDHLGPEGDPAGTWTVRGPGWSLRFAVAAVRAAEEGFGPLRSSYIQPIGRFTGTLPAPDGDPTAVEVTGVTETHLARW